MAVEAFSKVGEKHGNTSHTDLALVGVQPFQETRHVGSLKVVGKIHREREGANGVLKLFGPVKYNDWVSNSAHADAVNRNPTRVGAVLNIAEDGGGRCLFAQTSSLYVVKAPEVRMRGQ